MLVITKRLSKIRSNKTIKKFFEKIKAYSYDNLKNILYYVMCIFLCHSSIIGQLFPCSISFLCSYFYIKGPSLPILILSLISIATVKFELKYILLCIFIYIYYVFAKNKKRTNLLVDSFCFAMILFTVNTVIDIYYGYGIYAFLIGFFEILFIVSATFINREVILAFKKGNFNIDSTACFLAVIFICVLGFREFDIFGFNVLILFVFFSIIFVSSYINPFAGMILGLAFGICYYSRVAESAFYMLAFSFGGMCAGLLKHKLKFLSGIAFLLSSSVVLIYFDSLQLYKDNIVEISVSVLLYTIISFSFNDKLDKFINTNDVYEKKSNEIISKLNKLSSAINELTNSYIERIQQRNVNDKKVDIAVNSIYSKICTNCENMFDCWNKNHNKSYYSVVKTANNIAKNKNVIDSYIKNECVNYKEIIRELYKNVKNENYAPEETSDVMQGSNVLVSQLKETSNIINETVTQIKYIDINTKAAKHKIIISLKVEKIFVKSFEISDNKGVLGLIVTIETMRTMPETCSAISDTVYNITGTRMKCTEKIVATDKYFILRFSLLQKISAKAYYARLTKENSEISGDNYSFGTLDNKYYSILCDGMGTGARAYNESKSTINLLIKLLEANFNELQMIKTLNTLLMLNFENDRYVTLDFSIIDYELHEFRMYKAGAAPTFVITRDKVKKYQSSSLPIGILDTFECYYNKIDIQSGDTIIMMTDGIIDSVNENELKSLDKHIDLIKNKEPQSLANSILTYAIKGSKEVIDDMTVLVIRVM